MALIPDPAADLGRLFWMILAHNVFSAMQDVSVDALAVDLLREGERGRANGLMIGSKYAGSLLGGAVLSEVVGAAGLRAAFTVQVSLLAAIMLLPLLLRERAGERLLPWSRGAGAAPARGAASSLAEIFAALARAFKLRSPAVAAALALTEAIASMTITTIATVLFVQRLGWTEQETTRLTGGAGVIVGLVGSVAGGFLADLVGARRLIAAACALLAVTWIGFALLEPLWSHRPLVTGCVLAAALFAGILEVALLSLFMAVSWPRVAATQFTAYMALINASNTIGSWSAGFLEAHLGARGVFFAAGFFQCALPLLLPFIDPGQTRRELGE
jgi:PAT family beta-lactamase induction signal transducer AmpG